MTTDLTQYHHLIRSQVLKVAGGQVAYDEIEDLVSTVYLKLLESKLAKYNPDKGASLTTFVGIIARKEAIDAMRKLSRRPQTTGMEDLRETQQATLVSTEVNALAALIHREHHGRVKAAVNGLKDDEKDLIEAMMMDDFDTEAYAKKHGISTNTVYTKKHKAIKKLKAVLTSKRRAA